MAYSDYGGYAFRNGKRVEDRSDWTLTPDGGVGTPGAWGGFAAMAQGMSPDDIREFVKLPQYHAAMGDGPVYVGLRKQSHITIHNGMDEIDLFSVCSDLPPEKIGEYNGRKYINYDAFVDDPRPTRFEFIGHVLEVFWRETDNNYVFARLTDPKGTKWTAFSGYGVGAGLEDSGYGFDTNECVRVLEDLFPQ